MTYLEHWRAFALLRTKSREGYLNERRLGAGLAALVALMINGCVPHVDDTRIYDERPIGEARSAAERREPDPEITSSVSGDTVHISAVQRTECRSTTTTPDEREEGVGHSLHNGTLAQGLNLALSGALIVGGIAIYGAANSSSCTTTPNATPSNPNPSAVPCTADQQQTQTAQTRGLGVVTATAAILPLGAFVWNILRAQDETKTEPISPSVAATDWKTCATAPMANRSIIIEAGGTTVSGQTDDHGAATLDVSPIASATTDPQNGTVHIDGGNRQATETLSLAGAPAYAAWKQAAEGQARFSRQATIIQDSEGSLALMDTALDGLEHTPDPWGDDQLSEMQQVMSNWRQVQSLADSLKREQPIDPRLTNRLRALSSTLGRVVARVPRLKPHVDKLAARKQENDAFLFGLLAAAVRNGAYGSQPMASAGGSSHSNDDSRMRDVEKRQSDLEDQRRRDQAESAQRKADDDARRNVARNECSERCFSRAVFGACNDSCGINDLSCRNRCSDTAQQCRQDCQSR